MIVLTNHDQAISTMSSQTLRECRVELVCFGMIIDLVAEISGKFSTESNEMQSNLPVALDSTGSFSILKESMVQGRISPDFLPVVEEITQSCLTVQAFCTPEHQPRLSHPKRQIAAAIQNSCTLSMILYGPMDMLEEVGSFLQYHGLYLQDPKGCEINVFYCNPHSLPLPKGQTYIHTFDLEETEASVLLEELPEQHDLLEALSTNESLEETCQPLGIKTKLDRHQKQALTFMMRRERGWQFDGRYPDIWRTLSTSTGVRYINCVSYSSQGEVPPHFAGGIIADPMGFGKTLTMISLIATDNNIPNGGRGDFYEDATLPSSSTCRTLTLIVVPVSLLSTWEEQLREHVHDGALLWHRHYGKARLNNATDLPANCNMVLTTYQTLSSDWRNSTGSQTSPLYSISWRRIVLDEAHVIRNGLSQVAKAICDLDAESRWAVTGTPIQNRLGDVATLVKFLRPYPYGDVKQFDIDIGQLWKTGNVEEALTRLKRLLSCITLRRPPWTIDLPPRHDLVFPLNFSDQELKIYEETKAHAVRRIEEALFASSEVSSTYANALQQINSLRMICNLGIHYQPPREKRNVNASASEDWDNHAQRTFDSRREFGDIFCYKCNLAIEATAINTAEIRVPNETSSLFYQCETFICAACAMAASNPFLELDCGHTPSCALARISVNEPESQCRPYIDTSILSSEKPPTKIAALMSHLKLLKPDVKWYVWCFIKMPLTSVVFSYWRSTLDLIESALKNTSINSVRFDGGLTPKERQASVERFQEDPSIRVMLLTLSCGAVGLTLTVATHAYLMEPHWNPTVEEQALARIHRMGQKNEVTTIRFFIKDTLEQHVIDIQKKKKHLADVLLLSRNSESGKDTASRLEWLRSLL
ncbi:SNF2 family N-terminal domain-containing protein [Trichoderma ceciliae]